MPAQWQFPLDRPNQEQHIRRCLAAACAHKYTRIGIAAEVHAFIVAPAVGMLVELDLEFLRERRCDIAQGFYLALPQPIAQLPR